MTGEERRNGLLNTILEADAPISGAALARKYQVSRQVIVQDMALLRAAHHEVYATPKGYVILQSRKDDEKKETSIIQEQKQQGSFIR